MKRSASSWCLSLILGAVILAVSVVQFQLMRANAE